MRRIRAWAPGHSAPLLAALVASTGVRLAGLAPGHFVSRAGGRRAGLLLAATLLPLAVLALTGPGIPAPAARALIDPRVYWPLGRLTLAVEPGDVLVARGSALVVTARARGARPRAVLVRTEEPGGGTALSGMRREAAEGGERQEEFGGSQQERGS